MRVLLIEDHRPIAANVVDYLGALGHEVVCETDGKAGLDRALAEDFEVLLLDRMLPGLDGDEVCRRLRRNKPELPILMLTALDSVEDKVVGFEAGADDYLSKPFALAELKVRVEALVRRTRQRQTERVLQVADLRYDLDAMLAARAGVPLTLSPTGRRLLEHLMRESPRVVPREELERVVWGLEAPDPDALRVHIHALRNAVDRPFDSKLLRTVHGAGYRLAPDGA
jgi:DNA-binding response OmpR family regulator